jgi:hypothetical protein
MEINKSQNPFTALIEKTEKGCGNEYLSIDGLVICKGKNYDSETDEYIDTSPLCPSCQSRLATLHEVEKIFNESELFSKDKMLVDKDFEDFIRRDEAKKCQARFDDFLEKIDEKISEIINEGHCGTEWANTWLEEIRGEIKSLAGQEKKK